MLAPAVPASEEMDSAPAGVAHAVDHGPGAVQHPEEVDLDRTNPGRRIHLAEWSHAHRLGATMPGVVDQYVDPQGDSPPLT